MWLLLDGKLEQEGLPEDVVRRPLSRAAADFVGTVNLLDGQVIGSSEGMCRVHCGAHQVVAEGSQPPGAHVYVCVRPEDLLLSTSPDHTSSARNHIDACVLHIEVQGHLRCVDLDAGFKLRAFVTREAVQDLDIRPGKRIVASFNASAAHLLAHATQPEDAQAPLTGSGTEASAARQDA
jgi:tungstate transport system ATP-binding protein